MDKPVLDDITVEITNHCRLRCVMCGIGRERVRREITAATFSAMLAHLQQHFVLRSISLTGGEPFLHPELGAMLSHLARLRLARRIVSFGVYTNGTQTAAIKKLLGAKQEFFRGMNIGLSLDGMEQVHDRRRGRGSFKKSMATLEWLATQNPGFFNIEVKFTAGADNVHEMEDVYRIAVAQRVRFSPKLMESGVKAYYHRSGSGDCCRPDSVFSAECLAQLRAVIRDEAAFRRATVDLRMLKVLMSLVRRGGKVITRCDTPEQCLFITSTGKVYPCLYMEPAGDIYSAGFPEKDFFRQRAGRIRQGRIADCPRCTAYHGFLKDFNAGFIV